MLSLFFSYDLQVLAGQHLVLSRGSVLGGVSQAFVLHALSISAGV